jgi:hypothetical protein
LASRPFPVQKAAALFFILYTIFKKKTSAGMSYFRWYYYFYGQNGKKIQKACRGCHTRQEAGNFIKTLPAEVN